MLNLFIHRNTENKSVIAKCVTFTVDDMLVKLDFCVRFVSPQIPAHDPTCSKVVNSEKQSFLQVGQFRLNTLDDWPICDLVVL